MFNCQRSMTRLLRFPILALLIFDATYITILPPQILAQTSKPYLDDRSDPVQVLKSYYNAINLKQYVRAYYYWRQVGTSATSQPPAYPQFEAGYKDTAVVELTTGKVTGDGAAGSVYYRVPVILQATLTNHSKRTFVGCYTLKQVNPFVFGVPPFIPIGIDSAQIQAVPNSANLQLLMNSSCR